MSRWNERRGLCSPLYYGGSQIDPGLLSLYDWRTNEYHTLHMILMILIPANTTHLHNVGPMLGPRRRQWANIGQTLCRPKYVVLSGILPRQTTYVGCMLLQRWHSVCDMAEHCSNVGLTLGVCPYAICKSTASDLRIITTIEISYYSVGLMLEWRLFSTCTSAGNYR